MSGVNGVDVQIRRMRLSELKLAEYNPRKITDEAFGGLGSSISRFGILSYIVWNQRTGNIVGGHQRYEHLMDMGEVETDVVVVDLDDNSEIALNITLNNREIRGGFTKEVAEQLRTTEVQLGSAFKQLGLLDLYDYLQKHGFAGEERVKKKNKTERSGQGNVGSIGGSDDDKKPQALISCPKCRSQWRLTNEVVFNGVLGQGIRMTGDK
jgi:hypothetical protein